jgi:hypothetical protein
MKALWKQYLNEIIGLTIMALMTVALVAGQAQATPDPTIQDASHAILEIRLTISD